MKTKFRFIGVVLFLFLFCFTGTAQMEMKKMDELRMGIVRLRQACLDSLHHSLIYLEEMRNTIEQADIQQNERQALLYHFLGEGQRPDGYHEGRGWLGGNFGNEKYHHLDALKFKQAWPKYILNTLATYGQLDREYPHNMTGSNYFYGLFSFFNFEQGDEIAVLGEMRKESLFALMLGLYVEKTKIHLNKRNPHDLTRFFKNKLDALAADGTEFHQIDFSAFGSGSLEEVKSEMDHFLLVDLFELDNQKFLLSFVHQSLTPQGELCIIETSKGNLRNNLKHSRLLSSKKIKRLARKAGFRLTGEENLELLKLYRFSKG